MAGFMVRRTAAAAALVIGAGGLVASTVAPSTAAVPVSGVCKIEVVSASNGSHVGWLGPIDPGPHGRTLNLSTITDEADAPTYDVGAGPRQELFLHDSGVRIGLTGNFEDTYGFGFVGKVAHTDPGATAGDDPDAWDSRVQSSVWSVSDQGVLTATWIDRDGNPAVVSFSDDDERPSNGRYVIGTGPGGYYGTVYPRVLLRTSGCTGGQQAQAISFTSSAPEGARPKGSYTVAATGGGSTSPVVFTSTTPGVCRVKGAKVTFIKNGTCTVAADQAGDSGYSAAPRMTQDIQVGRIAQSIAFTSPPPSPANPGGTYDVTASGGGSGKPVTFSTNAGICTVAGGVVTFVRTGKCVITAKQVGNSRYAPASNAKQTINVVKAPKSFDGP